jgi:hypothetical protein
LKAEVEKAKAAWDAIRGTPAGLEKGPNGQPKQRPFRVKYETLQAEYLSLTDPASRGHAVHGVRDGKAPADTEVRIRGEAEKLGPVVPRGFVTAFAVPGAPAVNPAQSGRKELAEWLASPANPLTARVAANRVWYHLFGRGVVSTVDNFGVTGDVPSNPALLDHLASRFVEGGWSTKKLVRALVLTRAYQLSSETTPAHLTADPANALVWRHSPRRLDAEELRDAALATAGNLDRKRPEGSPAQKLRMVEMRDNGPEAKTLREAADRFQVRSVYLPLVRGVTPAALEPLDPVDQTLVSGQRDATTVPTQALFLLNSSFVRKQALALGERVLAADASDSDRLRTAYRLAVGRTPTDAEVARAEAFLAEYRSDYREPKPAKPKDKPKPAAKPAGTPEPPFDPDQVDQTGEVIVEDAVVPKNAEAAAWLAFAQALFGSAEFRYVK